MSKAKDGVPDFPKDEEAGEASEDNEAESKTYDLACNLCDALGVHPDKADSVASVLMDLKDHFSTKEE